MILCVRADGKKLKPMIIYKGSPTGLIYKNECRPYNNSNGAQAYLTV